MADILGALVKRDLPSFIDALSNHRLFNERVVTLTLESPDACGYEISAALKLTDGCVLFLRLQRVIDPEPLLDQLTAACYRFGLQPVRLKYQCGDCGKHFAIPVRNYQTGEDECPHCGSSTF